MSETARRETMRYSREWTGCIRVMTISVETIATTDAI
jgi:hypothetical protein